MSKASEPAKRRRFAWHGNSKTHLVAIGIALGGVALLAGLVAAGGALKGWWRERQRARADELVGEIERRLKEGNFAAAAHAEGILHGDVKPANILRVRKGAQQALEKIQGGR